MISINAQQEGKPPHSGCLFAFIGFAEGKEAAGGGGCNKGSERTGKKINLRQHLSFSSKVTEYPLGRSVRVGEGGGAAGGGGDLLHISALPQ